MRMHSKLALMALAAAVSLPAALAQSPANAQDQSQATQSARPAGPMGPGRMRPGFGSGRGYFVFRSRGGMRGFGVWQRGRGMGMRARGGREFMLGRLLNNPEFRQRLGITDDQAAKIRQQTTDFQKSQIRSRADLQVKRLDLRNLLSAATPDRAAIDKELDDISATRLAQEKAAMDFRLDMRSALTPEQRQKLQQMRQDFGRGGGMKRGQGFGQGRMRGSQGQKPAPPSDPGQ